VVSGSASQAGAVKRSHLRELGLPTLFGAVVLLVSATLLLGANIAALRGNLRWMEHSQAVLTHLDILEAAVLSEELTVRGYALTGDARFLGYQKNERGRCIRALTELKRLGADDTLRAKEFGAVNQNARTHLDLFGKLVIQGPDRAAVVARAIVDPVVRDNMYRTRKSMEALRAAALHDLGERQLDLTDQLGRAFLMAVGIIIAAFLLGGVGVWAAQLKAPQHR
jgi:CHASE3 domain sensor protein